MNDLSQTASANFAPMLYLVNVADGMAYYKKAFNAIELRSWKNDDGSVHVAELSIAGAMFHLHEEVPGKSQLSPTTLKGTSVEIGLFVNDTDGLMKQAIAAGGKEISPMQTYEYGYRQGTVADPFGHHWQIQKLVTETAG